MSLMSIKNYVSCIKKQIQTHFLWIVWTGAICISISFLWCYFSDVAYEKNRLYQSISRYRYYTEDLVMDVEFNATGDYDLTRDYIDDRKGMLFSLAEVSYQKEEMKVVRWTAEEDESTSRFLIAMGLIARDWEMLPPSLNPQVVQSEEFALVKAYLRVLTSNMEVSRTLDELIKNLNQDRSVDKWLEAYDEYIQMKHARSSEPSKSGGAGSS